MLRLRTAKCVLEASSTAGMYCFASVVHRALCESTCLYVSALRSLTRRQQNTCHAANSF